MAKVKKQQVENKHLTLTLRELEKSLNAWDNVRSNDAIKEKQKADEKIQAKESELAMKTQLLLLALKDQISELS